MPVRLSVAGAERFEVVFETIREIRETLLDEWSFAGSAILLSRIRRRFQQQVDPEGKRWPPSRAAIIRQSGGFTFSNGRRVTGGQTLFATGRLFHSLRNERRGPGEAAVFTNVEYADIHNRGLGGQERREFMGFNDEDIALIEDEGLRIIGREVRRLD